MNYNDAEKVRSMIAGHWNIMMDDATADLWLGALLPKDADTAVKAVGRMSKIDMNRKPRISDLEEIYLMLVSSAALPPAEICGTCGGDLFVFVGLRPPVQTQWMRDHGHTPASGTPGMIEEYAPCPDCNTECNTSFPRHNGSVFNSPDPGIVRERMAPTVVHKQRVTDGPQKLPGDIADYLRDMHGIVGDFEIAEAGECEECRRDGRRFKYGTFELCEPCCSRRQKMSEKLVDHEEFVALLKDVE